MWVGEGVDEGPSPGSQGGGGGGDRELGQAPPPSPKCPTNQMTSIPEVIPAGGGGSDKVTLPLFSPPPASRQLSPHSPFSLFVSASVD